MNEFHNEGFKNNAIIGGKNLFTTDKIIPNVFIPNQIQLKSSSSDSNDNKVYDFSCKDDNINGINHFIVEIGLKELRGKGTVAYQKNLAYQLINSFKIRSVNNTKNDCFLINQREILNNVKQLGYKTFHKWSVQAGTNKGLCNFTTSKQEAGLLKPKTKIYAKIKLPFDNAITEILKFPKGSELLITLTLKSLNDAMCYSSNYMTNLTPKDMFEYVNLYAYSYNYLAGENIPCCYIEHEESLILKTGVLKNMPLSNHLDNQRVYEDTKNISRNITCVKLLVDAFLSGKRFLTYPGYNQSESNWLKCYHDKIIKELIIEVDEYTDIEDYVKEHYEIRPVNSNNVNYRNPKLVPIEEAKNITIDIYNIPKGKKLYYHTNLLGYNYTHERSNYLTNISDKFNLIEGEYHNNKLIFNNIESTIDILDISTPLDVWNSPNGFNNRAKNRELDYVIINDNFYTGLDFLGKYQPLEQLGLYIDTDFSNDKEKRSLTSFKNANIFLLNGISSCDKYPQEYYYRYSHNLFGIKPNTFKINKSITTYLSFYDYKNQIAEYDINVNLKLYSIKEVKVKEGVVLSEYI